VYQIPEYKEHGTSESAVLIENAPDFVQKRTHQKATEGGRDLMPFVRFVGFVE
jgi:hypothetical protein